MATVKRAETIALAGLSKSIDKAIALAAERHKAVFDKPNLVVNWEIVGRILREMAVGGRQTRLDLAATVVRGLPGIKGQPVVTKIGKDVFVGFIERSGRPIAF